jgi:hypothetical protein
MGELTIRQPQGLKPTSPVIRLAQLLGKIRNQLL